MVEVEKNARGLTIADYKCKVCSHVMYNLFTANEVPKRCPKCQTPYPPMTFLPKRSLNRRF